MSIKIKPVKCPVCGAPITNQSGAPQIFCSYCGQRLVIDDGVKRSEHTYRKIDEARIREAEARIKVAEAKERQEALRAKQEEIRAKQEAARARREAAGAVWDVLSLVVPRLLPLLFVPILFFSCRAMYRALEKSNEEWKLERAKEEAEEEEREQKIAAQILPICKNNGATIEHIYASTDSVSFTILASNGSRESIDTLQDEIVNSLVLDEGMNASISIDYPEYHTLRWFEIDEYGQVKIRDDSTNSISEEECKKLLEEYEESLKPILADYKAELLSDKYEGDVLKLEIKSSTSKKKKIDNLIKDIMNMNRSLKSLQMEIWFRKESGDTLCMVDIDLDNSINITNDHTK